MKNENTTTMHLSVKAMLEAVGTITLDGDMTIKAGPLVTRPLMRIRVFTSSETCTTHLAVLEGKALLEWAKNYAQA